MLTLGIDLASQPRNTGLCELTWEGGPARVTRVEVGLDNAQLVAAIHRVDAVGVDAPFGWPEPFRDAIAAWGDGGDWPRAWGPETVRALSLRETDLLVHERTGRWPLSVSTDRIAICAMRAASLLTELRRAGLKTDRVDGPVFEVYPGVALKWWGLDAKGYKRDPAVRDRLLASLGGDWLELTADDRALCVGVDHAFDALVSGLVARAAATRRTVLPSPDERVRAEREGWIHLPDCPPRELARASQARD
jgi:predicted nuclease with RNAse H fold